MIRIFDSTETNFNHHENVLSDVISCKVTEEENGTFFVELVTPIDHRIEENKILKVPTPRGEQLFRISKPVRSLDGGKRVYSVFGMHIFYDLLDNFILNIRPTDVTAINAGKAILDGTELPHRFTFTSNVQGINTSNFVRMNPVQAIMGNQENSLLDRWGGFLYRDNFEIDLRATPLDRGYEIAFGKNLIGVKEDIDVSGVVTRLYPTVVIEGNEVTALPEKYVDSPLINSYHQIKIKEHRIALTDEQKLLPIEEIYNFMREGCQALFATGLDKPRVNYKVDFVELSKTEQYKELSILESLDISDTVSVAVSPLNLLVDARLVKYSYDALRQRFLTCELGNLKSRLTSQTSEIKKLIEDTTGMIIEGEISALLKSAIDRITGHRGGYRYDLFNPDGLPSGTIYMDSEDVNTAQHYILINNQGIAFGDSGISNPPTVAIDIQGRIVAGSGFFESLKTNLIESDIGQSLDLSSNTSINQAVKDIFSGEIMTVSATAPESPTAGRLWLDTSVSPNLIKRWDGSDWVTVSDLTQLEELVASKASQSDLDSQIANVVASIQASLESEITQTNDTFNIKFSETIDAINAAGDRISALSSEIETNIRFTADGIELGKSTNPVSVKILPDRVSFSEGGQEVAYFSNNKLYVTDIHVLTSLRIGNFAFFPRSSGNLSFKKVT